MFYILELRVYLDSARTAETGDTGAVHVRHQGPSILGSLAHPKPNAATIRSQSRVI
jgi:hypothetical protein